MPNTDVAERLAEDVGSKESRHQLFALIYGELKNRAGKILAAHQNPSLGATALVHEAYLKLVGANIHTCSKKHFFSLASRAMRQIMVDHARHRLYQKRDQRLLEALDDDMPHPAATNMPDLVVLDRALDLLSAQEPDLAEVVELHFFGGLGFGEIGEMKGCSLSTIERQWRSARALLRNTMS
ncbi:MAG: ECF-type sigma factor [Rudaea sp.]